MKDLTHTTTDQMSCEEYVGCVLCNQSDPALTEQYRDAGVSVQDIFNSHLGEMCNWLRNDWCGRADMKKRGLVADQGTLIILFDPENSDEKYQG
jgi:hypothetical protein